MKKIIRKLLVCFLAIILCACTSTKQYVAYTIYPIGYLLKQIGGEKIATTSIQHNSMVQVATIKKDYQEILADSFVLFHIGNLEPYIEIYEEDINDTGVSKVDLSSLNALYDFKRYTLTYVDGKDYYFESAYYEGEVFDSVDTYTLDLNIWLSPTGMRSMAIDIKDWLCSNYVEQSEYFQANFETIYDKLIVLDASYNTLSNKLKNSNKTIKFVTMSPSFGCWQKDYGFQVYPVCLSKYGALPSEAELEIIKARIVKDDVKYIAYEPNLPVEMISLMKQLEEELDLKEIYLYNISSLTESQIENNKDYLSLMYENLSTLESIASIE